jgi:hypothetical protein
MPWSSIYSEVQDRLSNKSESFQLFYNVRDTLYASESGFKQLRGGEDWEVVLTAVRQAFSCFRDLEVEILHKVHSHQLESVA